MKKLSYLWDFDSNFLKSTSYDDLKHEICLQLIKLTADLIKDIEYENKTFMSKIIVPKDSILQWKNVSIKINSLAPNCDQIAQKLKSMSASKIGKSSSYYNDFSVSKDSLLTKISVLIIELSSSAESFQNIDKDLHKRIKKSIFNNEQMVPGKIVPYKLLNKLKNQRTVLQKIFSVSKNLDTNHQSQKLSDCEWMLDCILQDKLLNSILNRDQIIDKTLQKLRELSKYAFSVYEDKVNEQILSESSEKRSTVYSKTSETDGMEDIDTLQKQLKEQSNDISKTINDLTKQVTLTIHLNFLRGSQELTKGKLHWRIINHFWRILKNLKLPF